MLIDRDDADSTDAATARERAERLALPIGLVLGGLGAAATR